ncbi:Melanocortin-2 receptor accessory protein 2 [Manis javanica]|nr:Melanocortin-2 receptor accessory protein 2 [Manis javanica]
MSAQRLISNRTSRKPASNSDYTWEYEYYEIGPVSFEGLKAHKSYFNSFICCFSGTTIRFHCDWILGWSHSRRDLHVFCADLADQDRSPTPRQCRVLEEIQCEQLCVRLRKTTGAR